jgi:hypothetical protein
MATMRNPRITLHFTPTRGSWLNMVEIFFGIITRQAIRRGSFTSVKDLTAAIRTLHRRLQRPLPALHLDQNRRRHPRPLQTRTKNIIYATLGDHDAALHHHLFDLAEAEREAVI